MQRIFYFNNTERLLLSEKYSINHFTNIKHKYVYTVKQYIIIYFD